MAYLDLPTLNQVEFVRLVPFAEKKLVFLDRFRLEIIHNLHHVVIGDARNLVFKEFHLAHYS